MEGWRDRGMEGWRDRGMEGWRDRGMEGRKDGGTEEWKDGRMEGQMDIAAAGGGGQKLRLQEQTGLMCLKGPNPCVTIRCYTRLHPNSSHFHLNVSINIE